MGLCGLNDRVRQWLGTALLAGSILPVGCRAAARTFLDLPERTGNGQPARNASQSATLQALDTEPPPPIEAVSNRDSVLALLPKDRVGQVDWKAALGLGVIRPRFAAPGRPSTMPMTGFDFDFQMKGEQPELDAYFPHSVHTQWLSCGTCHPRIFAYRGTEITMAAIDKGELCGRCHGSVAFPASACGRCHLPVGRDDESGPPFLGNDLRLPRAAPVDSSTALGGYPSARFSHFTHRIRFRCTACHPDLYATRLGADTLKMADIQRGESCGVCHNGRAAFGIIQCDRCHAPLKASADAKP